MCAYTYVHVCQNIHILYIYMCDAKVRHPPMCLVTGRKLCFATQFQFDAAGYSQERPPHKCVSFGRQLCLLPVLGPLVASVQTILVMLAMLAMQTTCTNLVHFSRGTCAPEFLVDCARYWRTYLAQCSAGGRIRGMPGKREMPGMLWKLKHSAHPLYG